MNARQTDSAVLGQPISDPAIWTGRDLETDQSWLYRLTADEIDSLLAMARETRKRIGNDPNALVELGRDDFDLGAFKPTLERLRHQLKDGLGVALIRGLPLAQMEQVDAAAVYWGIGRHIGEARSNNPDGDMLGHVTDLGKTQDDPNSRGYQTSEAMDYHCDQCSVVGLLCMREPQSGGKSKIASSLAIYNELLKRDPEAVKVLSEPLCWTKHGEVDAGQKNFYFSSVFNVLDEKLCVSFGPKHIEKGHNLPGAPKITDKQLAAIRLTEQVAEELHYAMQLQRGDMQFLNNFVTLHTRTAYKDWPEPAHRRLLYRLWLSAPDMRSPTNYVKEWDTGIILGKTKARIDL